MKRNSLLTYTDSGKPGQPVIVFLHGFLGNRGDWSDTLQLLSGRYRCVSIDLPGHGTSLIADERQYAMAETAGLVSATLAKLKIERCHLVGYSMGGRLALYIALHFPQLIESVILESASPGIENAEERMKRRQSDAELACRLLEGSAAEFIEEWYDRPLFESMKRYPERLTQLKNSRQSLFAGGLAASLRQMGTGSQPSLWHKLDMLIPSALLLVGERDNTFRSVAEQMKRRNDKLSVRILPDCGHNCHWENPRLFAESIVEFHSTEKVS
ncbi:MAG: 2-succinyl-6-hydroxy-2,4-cyclohexadiene-1-carboxylate synthase [Candidatus Zixiibacteriota bacterium]